MGPCFGVLAGQALASVQVGVVAHVDVDHGHTEAGRVNAPVPGNNDGDCHDKPKDWCMDCDLTTILAAKSEELSKVVTTTVGIPIVYFLQFASDYWIVVPSILSGLPHWVSAADTPQSMSILERTTRLRNYPIFLSTRIPPSASVVSSNKARLVILRHKLLRGRKRNVRQELQRRVKKMQHVWAIRTYVDRSFFCGLS